MLFVYIMFYCWINPHDVYYLRGYSDNVLTLEPDYILFLHFEPLINKILTLYIFGM